MLTALFTALCSIASAACAWFIVRLAVTSRGDWWRRGPMGRHTMALATALLVMTALANPLARELPGRAYWLITGMAALTAVLCWRVVLLEREQRAARRRRRGE